LASGLEYIHSKKLIHRDIKPENVLISIDSTTELVTIKWADFGLSKFVNERGTFTLSGIKGTTNYFAPELLKKIKKK
jgi:serine/threonine protein kinase